MLMSSSATLQGPVIALLLHILLQMNVAADFGKHTITPIVSFFFSPNEKTDFINRLIMLVINYQSGFILIYAGRF